MADHTSDPGSPGNALRRDPDWYRTALESALGIPFVHGNSITLLQNGDQIFPAMLEAIDDAVSSIEFATFVYWQGDIANQFAEAFERAAQRGVRVRLLLDAVGCNKMEKRHVSRLQGAGAEIRWFRPLATVRLWRLDKRTHRKILICDSVTGFTGGVGIAQEWTGDAQNPTQWRDTHARIVGPACVGLATAFRENWNEAGDWALDISGVEPARQDDGVLMQVVRSSGRVEWSDIATLIRSLISVAQKTIYIVTAYFVPDQTFIRLATAALERGVRVRLLVPGAYTDSRLSQLAGHPSIEVLARRGADVWLYNKTLLHAKLVVVDDYVSCIGSANLNHRSFGKDEECNVLVLDDDTAASLVERFHADCSEAELVGADRWQQRGLLLRVKERLARLVIEQL